MRILSVSRTVAAPVSAVFETLAAIDRTPEWSSSVEHVELLDPPPVRAGTRFRETRTHSQRSGGVDMTISDLVPNERIEILSAWGDVAITSQWRVEPDGDGTRITLEVDWAAPSLRGRIVVRLFACITRGVMRRAVDDDLDELERHLISDVRAHIA